MKWNILQKVKALRSFWFLHETTCFMKHSFAVHSLVLFCCQIAASSSHSLVAQAQTRTAPGNQLEHLLKMKQLQINKDSVTSEDSETLAEGISLPLSTTFGGSGPRKMTFKFGDKDRSPWGNS